MPIRNRGDDSITVKQVVSTDVAARIRQLINSGAITTQQLEKISGTTSQELIKNLDSEDISDEFVVKLNTAIDEAIGEGVGTDLGNSGVTSTGRGQGGTGWLSGRQWKGMTQEQKDKIMQQDQEKRDEAAGVEQQNGGEWGNYGDIFSKRPQYEIPQEVYDMLSEYQTGAQKLEGIYGKSRTEILSEARRSGKLGLEATKESGENALDIMRTRAYGGLPGERQYYEQLGATTAGAVRDITQRGGGGSQGALADIYGQQMAGQRDIMAQRAQYQASGMEGLSGLTRQTGLDLSNQYRTMAQDYISANLATTQGLGQAYQTGTAMRTAGLGNVANYKDVQWQYNQYQPALARESAYVDYMNKLQDQSFSQEMAMYNTESAQNYAMMSQALGGQTNAYQSFLNTLGQGAGTYAQMNMLNSWMGGRT